MLVWASGQKPNALNTGFTTVRPDAGRLQQSDKFHMNKMVSHGF